MEYQALYRKYRPNTFEDFIDQDNVKKILVNSIKNDKISHAYMFFGPRGIGKTSMAKIFAKAINCTNFNEKNDVCNHCENCIDSNNQSVDIVEIDAASNNGVDQIRDLKNKISIVPSNLKYKVYIIDEVHMLTNSAFNALLKTLEEPPSHVVFILATTEFYEVPETIVSRCQCFGFNRISMKSMENRLKMISKNENIDITDDAISEIAAYSNGGLRDAIGMLDKLRSFTTDKITVDIFKSINGMVSQEDINKFYQYSLSLEYENVLKIIDKINEQGYDFKNFIERVMIYTRDKIVNYYEKKDKEDLDVSLNVKYVNSLNEILNKLKETVNPVIIVQVLILDFMNEIDEKVEKRCKNSEISADFGEKNISREIIIEENRNVEKVPKSPNLQEKPLENRQNDIKNDTLAQFVVNEDNKKIRINNAMASANLNLKKSIINDWNNLNSYFLDEKFGKVAQLLSDTEPMVVGENYMILIAPSNGVIDNIYINLDLVDLLIEKISHKLSIVVLLDDEFKKIKEKYIEDRKNNIVYEIKEECGKLVDVHNNLINQAIDVFGTDIVDIE